MALLARQQQASGQAGSRTGEQWRRSVLDRRAKQPQLEVQWLAAGRQKRRQQQQQSWPKKAAVLTVKAQEGDKEAKASSCLHLDHVVPVV